MKKRYLYCIKDKILKQLVLSLIIYAVYKSMGMIDFNIMREARAAVETAIMKDYTIDEIKTAAVKCAAEIKDVNKAIAAVVIKANEESLRESEEKQYQMDN